MQESITPLIAAGMRAASSPIRLCMIVAVQATGRMVIEIGLLVSRPPTNLWWSMISIMSVLFILLGNSVGLLVSTTTTCVSSARFDIISGVAKPQCLSMKAASVLGVPSKIGSAAWPFTSLRYQAQIIALPVLSVSGALCPNTLIIIETSGGADFGSL